MDSPVFIQNNKFTELKASTLLSDLLAWSLFRSARIDVLDGNKKHLFSTVHQSSLRKTLTSYLPFFLLPIFKDAIVDAYIVYPIYAPGYTLDPAVPIVSSAKQRIDVYFTEPGPPNVYIDIEGKIQVLKQLHESANETVKHFRENKASIEKYLKS
jgi:hypothetical protein